MLWRLLSCGKGSASGQCYKKYNKKKFALQQTYSEHEPSETWVLSKLEVNAIEMSFMRLIIGRPNTYRIENKTFRRLKLKKICEKLVEAQMCWYGHIYRRNEHFLNRRVYEAKVMGKIIDCPWNFEGYGEGGGKGKLNYWAGLKEIMSYGASGKNWKQEVLI